MVKKSDSIKIIKLQMIPYINILRMYQYIGESTKNLHDNVDDFYNVQINYTTKKDTHYLYIENIKDKDDFHQVHFITDLLKIIDVLISYNI